jgi:hypothetical protein
MERVLHIVAAFSRFTYDNTPISADEWLRIHSDAPEGHSRYTLRLRLRTHRDNVILGTVTASSRIKVKQAADDFIKSAEYQIALDTYGIGVHTFPVIQWFEPEQLAAEIAAEQAKHADLDRKLAAEIKRREQWQNPVKINT